MKFAICNETFQGWPWERICDFVAQCGYQGLEVAPFTLGEDATRLSEGERWALRRKAESVGLQIPGLHWLLVSPPGLYINHPDPEVRKRTQQFLQGLIQLCHDLGGQYLVWGSPKQRQVYEGLTYSQAWQLAQEVISQLIPFLERFSVTLGVEALPHPETDFITTTEEAVRFVEEVNHPFVRLHLDVKSMCAEGDPSQIIRRYGGYAASFHANDANRRGPGFGEVDFGPIFEALKSVGYEGWISVEVFDYSPDPETIARESLRYLLRKSQGGNPKASTP